MGSPVKLSHIVLQTNRIALMRDWYLAVLGGEVVHQNPNLCFLAYDDEHHRIALPQFRPAGARRARPIPGSTISPSLSRRWASCSAITSGRRASDIEPHWCINHGPTTSLYYKDPDGNGVELQVDNFPDVADCKAYMRSPDFAPEPARHRVRPRRDADSACARACPSAPSWSAPISPRSWPEPCQCGLRGRYNPRLQSGGWAHGHASPPSSKSLGERTKCPR